MLVLPPKARAKDTKERSRLSEKALFDFLKSRIGKLEGVVITGGEPTIHKDLAKFLKKIKSMGFKIKLDTNGTNPEMLLPLLTKSLSSTRLGKRDGVRLVPLTMGIKGVKNNDKNNNPPIPPLSGGQLEVLPLQGGLIDYIAMDIKAPLEKYGEVVGLLSGRKSLRGPTAEAGTKQSRQEALTEIASLRRGGFARNDSLVDLSNIKESIKIIISSGLPYEFRTTLVPGLHTPADIKKMGRLIKGADKWYLQQFKADTDLVNKDFQKVRPFTEKEMEKMRKIGNKYVRECRVR